jgi:poly-gamma-glutamate capsule biosynthesis protein CapA/YwtB (metallophosphatase superfamily)
VGELKNMGIRIMTTANNHAMDGGPEGVFMTNRFLDEAGIAHAGTGKNLAEARRPDRRDFRDIVRSVRDGKQLSDFMVVAIHCHVNSFAFQAYSHDNSTPDFLVQLAHAAVDNGADVFVGHGVHTLRGIEIYKGKPIFYGISNFIYQNSPIPEITDPSRSENSLLDRTHQPDNKEALLTTSRYEEGKLVEVRLYPVDLGIEGTRPVSRNGQPLAASPEQALRILKLVQELSRPFGTSIAIENGVGVIQVRD